MALKFKLKTFTRLKPSGAYYNNPLLEEQKDMFSDVSDILLHMSSYSIQAIKQYIPHHTVAVYAPKTSYCLRDQLSHWMKALDELINNDAEMDIKTGLDVMCHFCIKLRIELNTIASDCSQLQLNSIVSNMQQHLYRLRDSVHAAMKSLGVDDKTASPITLMGAIGRASQIHDEVQTLLDAVKLAGEISTLDVVTLRYNLEELMATIDLLYRIVGVDVSFRHSVEEMMDPIIYGHIFGVTPDVGDAVTSGNHELLDD